MPPSSRPFNRIASREQVENIISTMRSQAGEDSDYFKVFAIGFNKTGTTSLYTLFEKLGFLGMDGPHWRRQNDWHIHYQFQAFTDGPPDDFKYLDRTFPNSKFVLNVRNLDEWIDSRIEHIKVRMQKPGYVPNMSMGREPDAEVIEHWIMRRQQHHYDVVNYFSDRPESLLILNYISDPDAPTKIANFLGVKDTDSEKPYVRSTQITRTADRLNNADLIYSTFSELGVAQADFKNDLIIPGIFVPKDFEVPQRMRPTKVK